MEEIKFIEVIMIIILIVNAIIINKMASLREELYSVAKQTEEHLNNLNNKIKEKNK